MQLVHTLYRTARGGLITAVSLMMIFTSFVPLVQAAEGDMCRNSQIISYSPSSGADLTTLDMLEYRVSEDTDTDSLSVVINEETYPVQYRSLDEGGYRAFVMFPQDAEGSVYVEMYADSSAEDACNDALTTSFVVDPDDEYTAYGVLEAPVYTKPAYTAPSNSTSQSVQTTPSQGNAAVSQDEPQVVAVADETERDSEATTSEDATGTSTASSSATSTLADADNATSTGVGIGTQAASIFQALTGSDPEECLEGASQWPWYVWLGIIWIWLVAMWLLIGYTVEPIYGNDRYARRLAITVGLGTLAMLVLWYLASSCHTQLWVPLVLAALGIALYWLYSEDSDHPSNYHMGPRE